jgi:hypothetical protein
VLRTALNNPADSSGVLHVASKRLPASSHILSEYFKKLSASFHVLSEYFKDAFSIFSCLVPPVGQNQRVEKTKYVSKARSSVVIRCVTDCMSGTILSWG